LNPLCIYHGNCADGFGAAWVVRRALGPDVDFHAGIYSQPPPDVTGREVYIVDFSYKRPVLLEMAAAAQNIVILDHHKTAAEDLRDLPAGIENLFAMFNMDRSGAMLAWEYFFKLQEPPELLLRIEDRDLWRFALPGTREIQASVFSYPYDFEVWDELMKRPIDKLFTEGMAIERKHHKDIAELLKVVTRRMEIGGYNVPVANLPYIHVSDAAHELAKGEPFAACYWDTPSGRVFGLRSTDAGVDVSQIAKRYGGGGHRNASGFTADWDVADTFEIRVPRAS
jgi:oligoribonuclease NrnB/cAMP/cGMP phosphodiesterase (DHH superfamily)